MQSLTLPRNRYRDWFAHSIRILMQAPVAFIVATVAFALAGVLSVYVPHAGLQTFAGMLAAHYYVGICANITRRKLGYPTVWHGLGNATFAGLGITIAGLATLLVMALNQLLSGTEMAEAARNTPIPPMAVLVFAPATTWLAYYLCGTLLFRYWFVTSLSQHTGEGLSSVFLTSWSAMDRNSAATVVALFGLLTPWLLVGVMGGLWMGLIVPFLPIAGIVIELSTLDAFDIRKPRHATDVAPVDA